MEMLPTNQLRGNAQKTWRCSLANHPSSEMSGARHCTGAGRADVQGGSGVVLQRAFLNVLLNTL